MYSVIDVSCKIIFTAPLPVQNPNVDLISQEISEKLNGSSVKTKVVQITNDYLVLQITFPEEFGM